MLDRLRRMGNKVALVNAETVEKLTYKEFTQYAVDLSVSLMKLGVGIGDVVALGSEKCNMFIPTALAVVFTGASYTSYDLKPGRGIAANATTRWYQIYIPDTQKHCRENFTMHSEGNVE